MYVGLKMLKNFVTVTPQTLVKDAERLLEENRLWKLLVMDQGKLVGYVRKSDIARALPSLVTSLDRHELNYLLAKLTIDKIMRTNIEVITPDVEIELAAKRMSDEDLAGLAVVSEDDELLGYINRNVMLDVFVEEMGMQQGGSRITLEVEDRSGVLHEISGVIKELGMSIISTATFYHDNKRVIVVRVDSTDPAPVAEALAAKGYRIVGPQDFEQEWR
ncbi:acetoin utilization protein AcuB [Paucidesulfovibrio gracilis DSM 16080]|uniref:Acetoin utilization protein AcuB n=1 Tax=Paucidesulfovibrio gracilis DSM 16080 TaxID=1121449 RepID=A0A1T4X1H9_9BACT|nr:CBS domain-containing protein [Paucidesulfovibrio gracilis]SKA83442.1 acetoin utilization protein AcuB [Paucidesulfovibrio gracilis DSM 16080]